MEPIRCIIVDDELSAIKTLESLIKQIPQLDLIATFSNPIDALSFLRKNDIYLAFVDINMDNLSGLDLAKLINSKIVFTTGHSDFALESYKFDNVVDYLLKPVFIEDLTRSVRKASTLFAAESIYYRANNEVLLTYKNDDVTVKINYDSIVYIEAKGHYSNLYLDDRQTLAPIPLWELEKSLPKSKFIRINKSSIVNSHKIIEDSAKQIVLLGGYTLRVSKAYFKKSETSLPTNLQ